MTGDETHDDFAIPGEDVTIGTDTVTEPLAVSDAVRDGLRYGCTWHGPRLTDHCCECGMLKFWRAELDAGRAVLPS